LIWNEPIEGQLAVKRYDSVEDGGVRKYVLCFADGGTVETVLIPHLGNYFSLCVSSSVGCPVHCRFCSIGREQFRRMLRSNEIVRQLEVAVSDFDFSGDLEVVSLMGMREPLLNYENVVNAATLSNLFKSDESIS